MADNLFELGKSTVKATADAGKKIAETTIEQITGAPSGVGSQQVDKASQPSEANKQQEVAVKRQREKQQYERVKAELDQYRQRKMQQDQQIAREKNQQEQEKAQKDAGEKQKKESFVQSLLKKVGAGAHGETAKQKE
ncbi:MAG: hypothetical protein UW64_C0017G0023 [Microgenomates group bacterium GW2011_GWC1_44_37]|uniref:Uncharacterized protein n=1 Tax=Candidatus Collierbacteria bacterium GW2011_GWB2_44_22 TaxID=1618387 RepID=A0A0G1HYM2_9BACT|nr:MAG: hypothetical protein UW31_C0010G0056 [Candidatus Collierbacteria bacterium GW2011_GWA2_44_13]KKT50815.1 MAG: hypothetical protein UW42_C0014G0010 [Candidatus Collierbacteria bacterium GW2011_GWB1_44_197]KKT51658.1 MAG: hypothetical protein UW44_C0009G0022 [Candidatus Collierbacteria bacterium GW2011_GWB2_44_22]KKT62586.1 MAG: hypothetical protein UW56_C0005G0022 [Candidatus Collierbacteria bacterium GW2011_GWD1_44_27]KKT66038.1 MAG: hypothetical protein UW58_C0014G0025 [Candidatus Colli